MFDFFSSIWYIAARFYDGTSALLKRAFAKIYIYIRVQSKSRKVTKEGFVSSLRQRSSREKKSCVGDDDRGDFFAFSFLDKIIGEDF